MPEAPLPDWLLRLADVPANEPRVPAKSKTPADIAEDRRRALVAVRTYRIHEMTRLTPPGTPL